MTGRGKFTSSGPVRRLQVAFVGRADSCKSHCWDKPVQARFEVSANADSNRGTGHLRTSAGHPADGIPLGHTVLPRGMRNSFDRIISA